MPGMILPFNGMLPTIDPQAFIAENAVVIGDTVIGAETGIWYNVVLRGDVHSIRIGNRVNIQDGTIVHVAKDRFPTIIGDDVSIGHMALIHACTLEPGCFVGMTAAVMDGAVVETGAMVAAGALVTPGKRVPAGELWAGRPASFMRKLTEKDYERFTWTVNQYASLAREYRAQQAK